MSSLDHDPTPPLSHSPNEIRITDEDVISISTDTPEYKNMAVQTDSRDIIPPPESEQSTWNCRLPSELMSLVLDCLVEDEALGTLANVQQTSRAMYSLTTPNLYRNIIVHQYQALKLFGLFDTFPQKDNSLFVGPVPDIHPLDLPVPQRLRYFFSHTQTLVFRLAYFPDFDYDAVQYSLDPLDRYKKVIESLWYLDQPTLWPAIRRCSLDLKARSHHRIGLYQAPKYSRRDLEGLATAVFTRIHATYLTIILPTSAPDPVAYEDATYWGDCFETLQADHVELVDHLPDDNLHCPRAKSSLTVYFKKSLLGDDGEPFKTRSNMGYLLNHCDSFIDVPHIRLVGLPRPGDVTDAGLAKSAEDFHDEIAMCWRGMMETRKDNGNLEDFKITIQPDTTSEGVESAISRIYKQPEDEE